MTNQSDRVVGGKLSETIECKKGCCVGAKVLHFQTDLLSRQSNRKTQILIIGKDAEYQPLVISQDDNQSIPSM